MTVDASNTACNNAALQYDRKYARAALHAARHLTCPAYGPLRLLLVDLLTDGGHQRADAYLHADDLINVATGVIVSVEAGEARTVPWPGGPYMETFVQAMYEMEISK
jgi:hypothetical protein